MDAGKALKGEYASNLATGAALASGGSVTCSDLICELEAARSLLWTLWEAALEAGMRDHKKKWKRVEATLEKAIATERGRSATAAISDTREQPSTK